MNFTIDFRVGIYAVVATAGCLMFLTHNKYLQNELADRDRRLGRG